MPIKMAKTGAPTTGKKLPKVQEMMEMIRQAKSPAPFFDRNDIKTSEISTSYYSLVQKKSKEKVGIRLSLNGILRSESFCSLIDICSLINKDANVAYVIEKNEFDEPGYVK